MQQLRLKAGAVTNGQAGADVNHLDWGGFTPLHRAAFDGRVEVARLLLDAGAKVNQQDAIGGRTPLHQAAGCRRPGLCADTLRAAALMLT